MLTILYFAVFVACAQGFANNAHLCDEIQSINCATQYTMGEADEEVCGSNKVTYKNYCYYGQARCTTPTIHIAYVGPCVTATVLPTTTTAATTMAPASTTAPVSATGATVKVTTPMASVTTPKATVMVSTTQDPLLQVFCSSKDSVSCSTTLDPVCGSDTNFYLNKCEFSKAKCDNLSLQAKDISFCTGAAGK